VAADSIVITMSVGDLATPAMVESVAKTNAALGQQVAMAPPAARPDSPAAPAGV
jgi:hypothetical protein